MSQSNESCPWLTDSSSCPWQTFMSPVDYPRYPNVSCHENLALGCILPRVPRMLLWTGLVRASGGLDQIAWLPEQAGPRAGHRSCAAGGAHVLACTRRGHHARRQHLTRAGAPVPDHGKSAALPSGRCVRWRQRHDNRDPQHLCDAVTYQPRIPAKA